MLIASGYSNVNISIYKAIIHVLCNTFQEPLSKTWHARIVIALAEYLVYSWKNLMF